MSAWRVPPAELPGEVADFLGSRRAAQLNLYRALSNSPDMVRAWMSFLWDLRDRCASPRGLRELMILRCAARHSSEYEWAHHVEMARHAGLTEAQIRDVRQPASADCFTESERLALELTDAICDCSVSEELAARVVEHFGPGVYVELSLTAAAYTMVARVLDALGVPLEGREDSQRSVDDGAGTFS